MGTSSIKKITIECPSCDNYFIIAFGGEAMPVCCPFCASELDGIDDDKDDVTEEESLLHDEVCERDVDDCTLYSEEDYYME